MEKRLFFIDNLRWFLAFLVVLHHCALPYVEGVWWHVDMPQNAVLLEPFIAINAGFFMGLFFFISSFFIIPSIERNGLRHFLKHRVIRLGGPIALFYFIINPMILYAYYHYFRMHEPLNFFQYYFQIYFGFGDRPAGWSGPAWPDQQFMHIWFIVHLLIYSFVFGFIYYLLPQKSEEKSQKNNCVYSEKNTHLKVVFLIAFLTILTFLTRVFFPIGYWTALIGFIPFEPAHMPQYLVMFALGIFAFKLGWVDRITDRVGRCWLVVGLLCITIRFFQIFLWSINPWELISGSFSLQGGIYALWETTLCISMSIGLIYLFKKYVNQPKKEYKTLSQNAYAIYLFHMPVVTFLQYAFISVSIPALYVFAITGLLSICLTLLITEYILRRLPILKAIL